MTRRTAAIERAAKRLVLVRVLPSRMLVDGEASHGPGALLELPADDAKGLVERGMVEPVKRGK